MPSDDATDCVCRGHRRHFSCKQRINRECRHFLLRFFADHADPVLIVNSASVLNRSVLVEEHDFRCPLSLQEIGQFLLTVDEHRKRNTSLVSISNDLREAVLDVGADSDKTHALVRVTN